MQTITYFSAEQKKITRNKLIEAYGMENMSNRELPTKALYLDQVPFEGIVYSSGERFKDTKTINSEYKKILPSIFSIIFYALSYPFLKITKQ